MNSMKTVLKLTPVSLYDIRGLESWLGDMALRGLTLKRLRPLFSTFEAGPARGTRFRAEPYQRKFDDDLPQAMLELYQDFGWSFAGAANDILVFSTQDPDAPEPHSDPELQGAIWRKLFRAKRRTFAASLLLAVIAAVCVFSSFLKDNTPVLNLLTTSAPWMFILLAVLLADIPRGWADMQRLALIAQQLEAGVPLDHRSAYPRRRWSTAAVTALYAVLLLLLIISQYILPFTGGNARRLDALDAFTPLSLAEVEGKGFVPRHFMGDGIDYANFFAVDHYLLCPNRWEVVQSGSITPEEWNRMEIWRYDLTGWLSGLSAPLARELLNNAMGLNQDIWWTSDDSTVWTVDYFSSEHAGFLAVARNGWFQIAAAAVGNKAVLVKYTGQGNLEDYLSGIVQMVQA